MARIKIRLKRDENGILVRVLIKHPMETGRRIDPHSGARIPAHFIEKLIVTHQGRIIASCALGPGISSDPYFAFRTRHGKAGESVSVFWRDNLGNSDEITKVIE